MIKKLVSLFFALVLFVAPITAQESLEEKTPAISAPKVKVETITNKRKVRIKPNKFVDPRKIVKTGRTSNPTPKEEWPLTPAQKQKLKLKEAAKIKFEEQRLRELSAKGPAAQEDADEIQPKAVITVGAGAGNPPDNSIAVSNTGFIVVADNSQITFLRDDGTFLDAFSYPDFLNDLPASVGNNTSDPKLIYDPEENKFIFYIQSGGSSSSSKCVLAFSKSDDPRDGWNVYDFNTIKDDGLWFDYPSLSVNYREVFVTGNLFNNDDHFAGNVVYAFHKDDGYANQDMNGVEWRDVTPSWSFTAAGGIIAVPASRSNMYGPGHYLLNTSATGGGDAFLYHITKHLENDPELKKYTIDIPDYEMAASAGQKGTTQRLDVGDCRIKGAYYQHGKVYFVFTKDDGYGFSGISFNRIRISDLAHESKYFHDNQNSDYCYPAICNRKGNEVDSSTLLVFQRSGKTTFPQIRKRLLSSSMSAVGASTSVKTGVSFRDAFRWGDYIGVQRKYGTDTAWLAGHTPSAGNSWRTHAISINLP